MADNYWPEQSSLPEQEVKDLLPDWSKANINDYFFRGIGGRRLKAALVLITLWLIVVGLYQFAWAEYLVYAIAAMMLGHILRLITVAPEKTSPAIEAQALTTYPRVSLLVSAKNEEAVMGRLVNNLCNLDYPAEQYEVWIINDGSSDRTGEVLDELQGQYPQLKVLHRPPHAGGGKCGALNDVMPKISGEFIGVFDADAQVQPTMLQQVIPLFQTAKVGAVQMRKTIINRPVNFLTKGQHTEMAFDAYWQQQRIGLGGIGELRGNGQFIRCSALYRCGGWNEQTITDDLDLSVRLHLDDWQIAFVGQNAVEEEGVTAAIALWHQRNRWAEGGFQRYLDYWRLILTQPLGFNKKADMIFFMVMQYLVPTATIPDLTMAIVNHRLPMLGPINVLIFLFSFVAIWQGLGRFDSHQQGETGNPILSKLQNTTRCFIYLLHWVIIIPFITLRMAIRQKQLKWVKTIHVG
jgi:1,2-diacylglycerol 3-beta-glucosyltransferase